MKSVWNDSVTLPSYPHLDGSRKTDVLIIGGGMAGILCAWELKQAGIDCLLIESDRIMGGVSVNTTAKITSQHGLIYDQLIRRFGVEKARLYLRANEAALSRYHRLSQTIPCDFETKDSYIYSMNLPEKLDRELSALSRIGFSGDFVSSLPFPFPVAGAVRLRDQAQFHPLRFVQGLLPGLRICEHTAARSWDGRSILTDYGRITPEKIIVATHFPIFNKHGSYFLKLYQHRSYVLGLKDGPQVNGMYMDEEKTGLSFRNYGDLLLLGGGAHRTGKSGGGWEELEVFARRHYPDCEIEYRWATQDCMSLDSVPYIGQYCASTPNIYVATGFNKWGMTTSMVAAGILRDLVQGKSNPYAKVFSPSRTMLRPQLALNALESTVNLLTPTRPRCPHMGCALKWNPQEHTWDCPCHGSRFSRDGKLLENPATDDLPRKPWQ